VPGPAGSGTGNVNGPATSTDEAIARYDATTGTLLQNSLVTIDDTGNVTLALAPTANMHAATKQYVDGKAVSGAASGITVAPVGGIAATDVQAALAELDNEKVAKAGDTMTGRLSAAAGTQALPSLGFTPDTASGFFRKAANQIAISCNNFEVANWSASGNYTTFGQSIGPNGTVGSPSFTFAGATSSGMYASGSSVLFSVSSTLRLTLSTTAIIAANPIVLPNSGTAAATMLNFGTAGVGLWGNAAALLFAVGGVQQFAIGSTSIAAALPFSVPAGVAGGASLKMPHGVAPTSPVDGDIWTTTLGIYTRINGATVGPLAAGGGAVAASAVTFTPAGNVAATNVQTAIAEVDSEKLALAGGTLTGDLYIAKVAPSLGLNKAAAGQQAALFGYTNNSTRWCLALGDSVAEGGSNAGSNFYIARYTDANAQIDKPITINRATGVVDFSVNPTVVGVALPKAPTISTSAPSGGVDGDVWYQVP
jgi:hypothetical protein